MTKERKQRTDKIHPSRTYSKKQENDVAKKFNGVRQLNSGATPFSKGDVVLDKWLLELKTKSTESSSISIKKEWFDKNDKEALFMGKPYNALVFNFGPNTKNHYIIDEYLFNTLVEILDNAENI